MPAVPSAVMEPLWVQFSALLPVRVDTHPLGCHRPRIPDRIVSGQAHPGPGAGGGLREGRRLHLLSGHHPTQTRVSGSPRECSPPWSRRPWMPTTRSSAWGWRTCASTAASSRPPAGARPPPLTGGPGHKQGTKRSIMVEGHGIPVGVQVAPANRHDSPLLAPTLECLGRFGFDLPEHITVHLDAGYDSRKTRELLEVLGCQARISPQRHPVAGR